MTCRRTPKGVKYYMSVKKIVCGVDFSDHSVRVFRAAADLARFYNADLRVIHAIEANLVPSQLTRAQTLDEKAILALELLIEQWGGGLNEGQVKAEVMTGNASAEIIDYARNFGADLIVIGAKGLKLLEESVIGGTAQRVVKDAPCSILVVRK